MDLVREVGEPRDVLAESLRLDARLEERLALLLGEDLCDLLDLAQHVACGLVQYLGALVGRHLRPCGERLRRRVRRAVHVRDVAEWNLVDHLAGGWVADLVSLAGRRLAPLAFDDHRRHANNYPCFPSPSGRGFGWGLNVSKARKGRQGRRPRPRPAAGERLRPFIPP